MNKVEDILVENIEDTEADKSSIEYHLDKYLSMWDKYLSMCGRLEPLMRLALEMRGMGGSIGEEV